MKVCNPFEASAAACPGVISETPVQERSELRVARLEAEIRRLQRAVTAGIAYVSLERLAMDSHGHS